MVNVEKWFPLGLAYGRAFCNRIGERKQLRYNVESCTHTLIMSPRRYGKTSLARKVIQESKLKYCEMDFNLVTDISSTQSIINNGVSDVLSAILPSHKKAISVLRKYFSKLEPSIKIDTHMGLKIEFKPRKELPQLEIVSVLQGLDQAASDANEKIIVFLDEFQQLAKIEGAELIEAAIRSAAQTSKNVSYIFSGSNRHLLELIFEDSTRPLFHLCDKMTLKRIDEKDYIPYLVKASKARWKKPIDKNFVSEIFKLTKRHPYYMNVLCSRIWREDSIPNVKNVNEIWEQYVMQEVPRISNDINSLSINQKKFLLLMAVRSVSQPSSQEITSLLNISVPSAAQSCKVLLQRDFIYLDDDGVYKILDPAIEAYLSYQR